MLKSCRPHFRQQREQAVSDRRSGVVLLDEAHGSSSALRYDRCLQRSAPAGAAFEMVAE